MNTADELLRQAQTYAKEGNENRSREILIEVIKQDPNNRIALIMLSGSYFVSKKFVEAEIIFERLIKMEPKQAKISIGLVNTLVALGKNDDALVEISRFKEVADAETDKELLDQYEKISDHLKAQ